MRYRDKKEAAHAMVREMFSAIPTRMINFYDGWELTARLDEDEAEEWGDEYGYACVPMWGWVWLVDDSYMERFVNDNSHAIMDLGFTILDNYEEGWTCLGIDGAGFDFYEAFWIPLYDLIGFKWHERR